jgi:hypothetical protein
MAKYKIIVLYSRERDGYKLHKIKSELDLTDIVKLSEPVRSFK